MNATDWEHIGPRGRGISAKEIGHFNARGMRLVYGRGDHFGGRVRGCTFHMDVWLTRNGRLLARFWTYMSEPDWESWEIIGLTHPAPPRNPTPRNPTCLSGLNEDWVPERLRDKYNDWIISWI